MIGFLLSVGSAVLFLRQLLIYGEFILSYIIGVTFITGMLVWNFIKSRKKNSEIYYSKSLLIAGLVWMKMPYFEWLIFVFVALAFLEYQAKMPLEIGFSDSEIVFNSLFKKKYQWREFSNVMLKDGLLTLDFNNNKLYQKEIENEESEATESEFNEWCGLKLTGS